MAIARALGAVFFTVSLAGLSLVAACDRRCSCEGATPCAPTAPPPASVSADLPGLQNFRQLSASFSRGGQPEGDAAFAELARRGVKTIVSVDGARPDVETAKRHGIRYVHVPVGYDGIPEDRALLLAKAFTALPGPFYVHCHHGKHRGPAACAIGRMLVDGITADQAVAEMKEAGTEAKYLGLYDVPAKFVRPSAEALAAVSADLPSVAPVPAFQKAMVEVDAGFSRVNAVKKAGWATPADQPDVTPAHEALLLAELFRELGRREEVAKRPEAFRAHLSTAEKAAWDLSKSLEPASRDTKAAAAAFDRIGQSCAACHAQYRDKKPVD